MRTPYRYVCAILAWVSLGAQYGLNLVSPDHANFAAATLNYVGYFTILTNILVALAFTAPLLSADRRILQFFEKPAVRAAIALYILVVAVVYHGLLADIHNPVGLDAIINQLLHTIIPILYIIDWVIFAAKRPLLYKHIPLWVIFPMIYGILTIIKGAITRVYPYPFLNVNELGYGGVFINMLGFTALYAIGAAVFISIGRMMDAKAKLAKS